MTLLIYIINVKSSNSVNGIVVFPTNCEYKSSYGKTVFFVRIIKELLRPIFLVFSYKVHLHLIFTVVCYKKCYKKVIKNAMIIF